VASEWPLAPTSLRVLVLVSEPQVDSTWVWAGRIARRFFPIRETAVVWALGRREP